MLISFEGGEGTGKGTAAKKLLAYLKKEGHDAVLYREPGSVEISEEIRKVVQRPRKGAHVNKVAELLLYEAARAQFVDEILKPAMAEDKIIILDRYFDSTTAYQGYGRDIKLNVIGALNELAIQGLVPDVTFLCDVTPMIAFKRMEKKEFGKEGDRMEQAGLDFHNKVREGYLEIAKQDPSRWVVIDAENNDENQVFEIVKEKVNEMLS